MNEWVFSSNAPKVALIDFTQPLQRNVQLNNIFSSTRIDSISHIRVLSLTHEVVYHFPFDFIDVLPVE